MRTLPKARSVTQKELVAYLLQGSNDTNVVVGPLVWQPSDGLSAKRWYFTIATSETQRGWRLDMVDVAEPSKDEDRAWVIAGLIFHQPSLLLHLTDDELEMAHICQALWPGKRINKMVRTIEQERMEAETVGPS